MRATRRFWTIVSVGIALGVWGLLIRSASVLIGAGAIAAWLIVAQYRFVTQVEESLSGLQVRLRADAERVTAEETTEVTLTASVSVATPVRIDATVPTPVGVDGTVEPVTLETLRRGTRRVDLSWPVAGVFDFETPQVTARDQFGLFTQRIAHGESPQILVEPRAPRSIHVGQGGEAVIGAFGEHETGQTGSGLKPADVRQYVPGDAVREIDWKATARLAEPHVREFEVETDRALTVFVDHRQSMGDGPDGERKLDYARQIVLAILSSARERSDPIGCHLIGDDGLTGRYEPSTTAAHVNRITSDVLSLAPTVSNDRDADVLPPAMAGSRARRLTDVDASSSFAETLAPYFDAQAEYVRLVEGEPFMTALDLYETGGSRADWMVFVTDDTNPTEIRESAKLARQLGTHVTVYLTPTVLFEPGGLEALDAAYDRYVEFETFRRDLDSLTGVSAFEVGPDDRLSSILDARRAQTGGTR